ncbi:MAG: sugar transferase [Blastocatellia bacterium]
MVRRSVDRLLAAAALFVLSPVLAAAALGIRLASPGPILYRARRAGRKNRVFTMYKFRTMHTMPGGSAITAQHDPRVFALARGCAAGRLTNCRSFSMSCAAKWHCRPAPRGTRALWREHYTRLCSMKHCACCRA